VPAIEQEIKELIITTLRLEDVSADSIDPNAPIFGEGLGLDSIDALELGVAIQKKYGIKITADADENRRYFSSVSNLARFVEERRSQGQEPR
jgi:acyl carrier protein